MNRNTEKVYLPDGQLFEFWDDETVYTKVYHVAREHPNASDQNPGTQDRPFATIDRAAQILQPGEKVLVHKGVYREHVKPARGGTDAAHMIAYEAAEDGVVICGSEKVEPALIQPGGGWMFGGFWNTVAVRTWQINLPAGWFTGYNPFLANNFFTEFNTFTPNWAVEETNRMLLRRGMVFVNGKALKQVLRPGEMSKETGVFWVEDPGMRLYVRLENDADPRGMEIEITTREQVFAPVEPRLGFVRVSGFQMRHAADGLPIPQRALLSAYRGHHWIIENNTISFANACGVDVGNESWHRERENDGHAVGYHIIRNNTISDCGVCGIAAVGNNDQSLLEYNTIERIGGLRLERLWETAGIKMHTCRNDLLRNNLIRDIIDAPGIWLDFLIRNTRITGNLIHDVHSLHGGIMVEVSQVPNLVDHNILWDIHGVEDIYHSAAGVTGSAIDIDTGEKCIVAHNFIAHNTGDYAINCHLAQKERVVMNRYMTGRGHQVYNNLLVNCPQQVKFARAEGNRCDGNLYDRTQNNQSFRIEYPPPDQRLDFTAWQEFYGFDAQGGQTEVKANFDPATRVLEIELGGEPPRAVGIDGLVGLEEETAGPWKLKKGKNKFHLRAGRQ